VLSSSSLGKECVESIITSSNSLVSWHGSIWLDAMFQAVQFPTGVTNLDSGLSLHRNQYAIVRHDTDS
jgi:hypothetical protein